MKTIIEMAREHQDHPDFGDLGHEVEFLERFAALVRADERDCVMSEPITKAHWQRFENDIRADEREACAKVAEDMNRAVLAMLNVTSQPKALAAAIRARENT